MINKRNLSFWDEKWEPIVFDGLESSPRYSVSNYGRLRSFQSVSTNSVSDQDTGKIIKGSVIQGYRSLNIRTAGKTINRYVHKLVAESFLHRDSDQQTFVIHLDHDKQNNHYQNLKWVTKDTMVEHNRQNPNVINRPVVRNSSNYKLTESKVKMIKKLLLNDKNRLKMIAKQFGITHTQLNRIRSGENWRHVTIHEQN
ncbi:NUMOD4 domain-containing protein [Spirosoma sp. KUDC1026]|uniref:NUMOD4 domain-containing protein n=1 Tax=Spirosoma sp. KUDC1026 TaxID=2745947 RepID=UPI00159BD7C8|nr:NUMOD4 domain-containing protein [Spirosoma sp. KUDC1026]QKZ12543.1 HNH endonuclease [Spirosoma sp. KUDC1026]